MKCDIVWLREEIQKIFEQEYKSWYKSGENIHRGHIPYTAFRATEKRILGLLRLQTKELREEPEVFYTHNRHVTYFTNYQIEIEGNRYIEVREFLGEPK